jgi:hypothetical protein
MATLTATSPSSTYPRPNPLERTISSVSDATTLRRRPSNDSTLAPSVVSSYRYADTDAASTVGSRTVLGESSRKKEGLRNILWNKIKRGDRAFEHPGSRGLRYVDILY